MHRLKYLESQEPPRFFERRHPGDFRASKVKVGRISSCVGQFH
jgi:hypothetical protein